MGRVLNMLVEFRQVNPSILFLRALGFAATRGKLYYRHPELFKVRDCRGFISDSTETACRIGRESEALN